MHHVPKLQKALGYKNRLNFVETALMTNFDLEEIRSPPKTMRGLGRKPRYVTARVVLDPDTEAGPGILQENKKKISCLEQKKSS